MAPHASSLLSRQIARSVRVASRPSLSSSATSNTLIPSAYRAFATSVQRNAERPPGLADVTPAGAKEFDAKQKEFRQQMVAAREKAERQYRISASSSSPDLSSSSSSSSSSSFAASGEDSSSAGVDGVFSTSKALGSLSPFNLGDHREAARANEDAPAGSGQKKGALASLIYGTEQGREMDREIERSFSQVLARGKYVHSIVSHEVKPDKVEEYVKLVGDWYPQVAHNADNHVNLVGSWRTEVGDADTFIHIWEYQRYHGYHNSLHTIQSQPAFIEFDKKLRTLINSKQISLMQEFSFWPTTPPRSLGGLFELRSYTLHPGNLLEWETHWRKGLQARREVMEGVGAWFVQIGDLNTVHHLWQFANLEERKKRREQSWSIEGWGDTVHKTVPLIQSMKSRILIPMKWSPVA